MGSSLKSREASHEGKRETESGVSIKREYKVRNEGSATSFIVAVFAANPASNNINYVQTRHIHKDTLNKGYQSPRGHAGKLECNRPNSIRKHILG